jgi:hypothetical protein
VSSYNFTGVNMSHTINATFTIKIYTITATAGAHGAISPSGAVIVNYGGNKRFDITPDTGYHIVDVKVDGHCKGPINNYTFTNVNANHKIEATFATSACKPCKLTVNKAGTGSGDVTASSGPLNWNGSNTVTVYYDCGKTVTLTAKPNANSTFTGWSAYCSGSGNCSVVIKGSTCTLKVCGQCTATATFKKKSSR